VDPQNKAKSLGIENAAVVSKQASVLADDCPSGYVCLYEHSNWVGHLLQVQGGIGIDHLGGIGCDGCISSDHPDSNGTWSDQMSSWKNFSGGTYCWTVDAGRQGEHHPMINNVVVNVTSHENDEATSLAPFVC